MQKCLSHYLIKNNKKLCLCAMAIRRILPSWLRAMSCVKCLNYPERIMIWVTSNNVHSDSTKKLLLGSLFEDNTVRNGYRQFDLSEWKCFIDQIHCYRSYVFFEGSRDGCEPLQWEGIIELLQYISQKGILCGVKTNGTQLSACSEALISARLDYLLCSFDYETGSDGSASSRKDIHEKIICGIAKVIREREKRNTAFPLVQLTTTISASNHRDLYTLAKEADALGVDVYAISFPVFTTSKVLRETSRLFLEKFGVEPKSWESFVTDLSAIDSRTVEEKILAIRKMKKRFIFKQFPSGIANFNAETYLKNPRLAFNRNHSCKAASNIAVVLPNGDVTTCCDHHDYLVGNVKKEKLVDIWTSERYRHFRKTVARKVFPSCYRCMGMYTDT